MKRLSAALVVASVGCSTPITEPPVMPGLVPGDDGGSLEFRFGTMEGVDEYVVKIDGVERFRGLAHSATVDSAGRGASIAVYYVQDGMEKELATTSISVIVTGNVVAWPTEDTLNPSYLEFDMSSGVVQATSDSLKGHVRVGGALPGGPFYLLSNVANNASWEARFASGDTSFATSDFAPHPSLFGAGATISAGDVFYCWLDTDPRGSWNAEDYFAKVEVVALDTLTGQVTTKWGVQSSLPGLRWLVD